MAFAIGLHGYGLVQCGWPERVLAISSGILLIDPGLTADIIGLFAIFIFIVLHSRNRRRTREGSPNTFTTGRV